jgi:hypothetical protein
LLIPNNGETMGIDESVNESLKTVEVKGQGTFEQQLDQAYAQVVKESKYTGDMHDAQKRATYFAVFRMEPILEDGHVAGVKICYSLPVKESPKKQSKPVAGCGPKMPEYTL